MEENIDKIFSILEDKKNEPLFKIYITQLAEINKNNPRSSNMILERALKLTRSNVWECRLVAAGILEKVIDNHLHALQLFGANERITLEIIDGMFIIEDIELPSDGSGKIKEEGQITQLKSLMDFENFIRLDSIDYNEVMNKEQPLLSRDTETAYKSKGNKLKEEKIEDEIFKKLENLSEDKNVISFMDFIDSIKNEQETWYNETNKSDRDTAADVDADEDEDYEQKPTGQMEEEENKNGQEDENNGVNEKMIKPRPGRGKKDEAKKEHAAASSSDRRQEIGKYESIEKKMKVSEIDWKTGTTQHIKIRSIFKLVYDFLSKSLFNPKWEIRHGACIALRNFIKKDIHKLYVNVNVPRSEIAAMNDHEENLTNFIRNTVRGLTYSNAFFEDFLARQLVIIALDRFMDHSSDRTQIIVRENSCQAIAKVLALLFGEDPIIYDRLFEIVTHFLRRKEWEIQIGALYLLKYVANLEEKTCPTIFENFSEKLLRMIDDNDDVMCVLAECFEIFVNKIPFAPNIQFFQKMNEGLWNILESLDDISFSNSMVTSVLTSLHQKEDYTLLYPKGLSFQKEQENLLALFQHKISLVRSSVYTLELSLLNIAQPSNYKESKSYFENLLKVSIQNFMVESGKAHITNLLFLIEELVTNLWPINPTFCMQMLRYLVESSCMYDFKDVVKRFTSFAKVNFDPYSFVDSSTDPATNLLQTYERLLKTGILFNKIINRNSDTIAFFNSVFGETIGSNHFILFCYLFVMVQTYTESNKSEDFKNMFDKSIIDTILTWEYSTIKSPYLDMVQLTIQRTINSMKQLLQMILQQRNCSNTTRQIAQTICGIDQVDPSLFETLYQVLDTANNHYNSSNELQDIEKVNMLNCIQSLQYQISDYVTRGNELLNSLKTMCAGISVINSTIDGKPFEKLNAIIPPVVSNLLKPNFVAVSKLTAYFLYVIIKFYEGAKASPTTKIVKNIFGLIFDEKIAAIIEKAKDNKEKEKIAPFEDKKNLQENDFLVTGSRYTAFVEFVKLLIQKNGENFFKVYPMLLEMLTNEFSKLQEFDPLDIQPGHLQYLNIQELYKTLKLMNIFRKIQTELFFLPESKILLDNLVKAFALMNLFAFAPKDPVTTIFHGKCVKICFKLLRSYLQTLKAMKNENQICLLLQKLYSLLKRNNLIFLQFLYIVHETSIEEFVDYTKIFIIQCIKKINSEVTEIRKAAVRAFASMINSIFIKDTRIELSGFPFLQKKYEKGYKFVFEFKNNKNFEFALQTKLNTELRSYQVEGIKWLSFLVRYNMSAALCDDMGLGKTIQTLSVLQEEIYKQSKKVNEKGLFSIIVVPSSLTEHWHYEIQRFCDRSIIRPFVFSAANQRSQVWNPDKYNLIIISYLMLSKHIEQFKEYKYLFMILDEAHLLKNPKSRTYKSLKEVNAQHKVALTGTPIQNNIVELWSIFDVIMPGYLGDEEHFRSKYAKYFNTSLLKTAAKDMIISSEQDEILEELHRKVKPFILRRDKMSVLSELPPKVIQDYYCHMTDIQEKIYREFDRLQVSKCDNDLSKNKGEEENKKVSTDIFQLLNTLRRICNHPYLFVKQAASSPILQNLKLTPAALETYEVSGKLLALKELFNEMGFEDSENSQPIDYSNNYNKILLFSRYKETLDVINKYFVNKLFPGLKYLRIDGSIAPAKRFEMVKKFNQDNNIKLLLLTTSVGGVGLNLHTANVVVMFDHDYNPMNDLQAIDRAHRIGQKNVLNVYRLIVKDTLEEQIMGIQRFKINVANSVINIDNSSIENVKQSNLLSLFSTIKQDDKGRPQEKKTANVAYDKYSKILEGMDELWEEDQYAKEY